MRSRRPLLAGLLVPAVFGLTAGPGAARQAEVRAASELLRVDVVAVDRTGAPVTDLKREEVEVWIGGYRVPIETFVAVTPGRGPRREIVLLLDDITLAPAVAPRARDVARRFVNRMAPGDRMAIVTLNGSAMETTDDRARLLRTIDSYFVGATGVMPIVELGAHLLNSVRAIAMQLAEGAGGRKAIVGIGSAWLFDTPIPPPQAARDLRAEWTDAMRALGLAGASYYVIDPAGVGASPVGGGASGFARETGGHAFVNTNDLNGAADRILRETTSYYVIGVADPPVFRKAELRELDVRVQRRGVSVRARRAIPGNL